MEKLQASNFKHQGSSNCPSAKRPGARHFSPVAQVSNLLHRRFPIGIRVATPEVCVYSVGSQAGSPAIQQVGNLRYSSALSFSSRRRPSRAFTLIELMVVLVLIGILTAVMIPEMRGSYEDALLRSSSRELINVCHLAYSQAVSVNQVHRLKLDERTGKYFLEKRIRETELGGDFEQLKDVPGSEGTLDTRIKIQVRTVSEEPNIAPTADESATANEPPSTPEPAPAEGSSPPPELNEGIAFYPDGTADGREIVLRDREGFRVGLRISPVTARIQIVDLPRE